MTLKNLQKYLKDKPEVLVFGEKQCEKAAKAGNLKEVYFSNDCLERIKDKLVGFAKLSEIKIINLDEDRDELALVCKKKFQVSIVGVIAP